MKRRDFLKILSIIPLAGHNPIRLKKNIHFKERHLRANGAKIKWSEIKDWDNFNEYDWININIPTEDICQNLIPSEECLFWIGNYEVWRLDYTGDPELPFRLSFCGRKIELNGRIGYKKFGI